MSNAPAINDRLVCNAHRLVGIFFLVGKVYKNFCGMVSRYAERFLSNYIFQKLSQDENPRQG
jgi:hypothetical protein